MIQVTISRSNPALMTSIAKAGAIPAEVHELLLKIEIANGTQRADVIRLLCCGEIVWQEISQRVSTVRSAGRTVGTDTLEALAICVRTV